MLAFQKYISSVPPTICQSRHNYRSIRLPDLSYLHLSPFRFYFPLSDVLNFVNTTIDLQINPTLNAGGEKGFCTSARLANHPSCTNHPPETTSMTELPSETRGTTTRRIKSAMASLVPENTSEEMNKYQTTTTQFPLHCSVSAFSTSNRLLLARTRLHSSFLLSQH